MMTLRGPMQRSGRAWVRLFIGACLFFVIAPVELVASSCPTAIAPMPLTKSTQILARLLPSSHHSYSLRLSSRSVVHILLDQDAPDLTVCIFSPTGKELRSARAGFAGQFTTSFAVSVPGNYGIVVAAEGRMPQVDSATYRLQVEIAELDASVYASTVAAERAFLRGQELRTATPAKALRAAISWYQIAQQRWAAAGDVNGEARALTSAAEVLLDLSDYSRALQTFAAAEHLSSGTPRLLIRAMNGRARLYLDRWDSVAALQCTEDALRLSRSVRDPRAQADALVSRGEAHYLQTDDEAARKDLQEALTIAKTEGDRLSSARTLRALAWVEEDQGRLHNATSLMQEAEQLFRAIGDVRASANAIGDIATIQSIRGDRSSALNSHTETLRLLQTMGQRSGQAFMLEALGTDYLQLNEHALAAGYFGQALHQFAALDHLSGRQEALLELCRTELAMGRLKPAWQHCSKAVLLVSKLHDPKREAIALRNLGDVEDALGRTEKALLLYGRAAALSHRVHDPRFEAAALVSMGFVNARKGDQQTAIVLYTRALALSHDSEALDGEIDARYQLARSENVLGQFSDAQSQLDQALLLAEKERFGVASESLRASYFASIRKCYDLYVEILMARHAKDPAARFDRLALEKTEAGRARTLLDALAERSGPAIETDSALMARLRQLRRPLAAAYERRLQLMVRNGSQQVLADNAREISLLTAEYDRAIENARERPHELSVAAPVPTVAQTLSHFVEPGTVILEYMLGEEDSFVWRISQGDLTAYILPGREKIARDVQRWRKLVVARKPAQGESIAAYNSRVRRSDRELRDQSQRLGCELLRPLEGVNSWRLVLIPDGVLDSLPFAALPLNACSRTSGAPLLTEYEVVNLPSLLVLPALRDMEEQHRGTSGGVAVLADPVFSRDDPRVKPRPDGRQVPASAASPLGLALRDVGWSSGLPRLPATRREGKAIATKASAYNTFVALDFDASLATALSPKLSHYRILHLATHGLLDSEHPELSGLVFSLVDKAGNDIDGYLQAQEIYDLHLQTDLVVLSACNSGLGKQVSGEGTVGITRAFIHAGTPHVVSTLWSIEDEATSELMGYFYEAVLGKKESPASALREAQLRISREHRWSHPFYWAGFMLTGDWQ
jgi:CHAT domain-containing protein